MRLYLSSYGIGNKPEKLVNLVGENKRVALIANATDLDESYRSVGVEKQFSVLKSLGFTPEEIDLRKYFNKSEELKNALDGIGLLWVRGGNAFILQRAIEQSGLNKILPELLQKNSFVYGGYSAGVIVLSPTLKGVELVDDSVSIPSSYQTEFSWEGMNIIPYSIAPHFESDHPESEKVNLVIEYFKDNKIYFKTLRDGEVIIVDGKSEEIVS